MKYLVLLLIVVGGIWWIRQYEFAKHGVILNEMYNHLRDEQGLCESKQLQLRHCLFSGDWSHKLVQRALSKVGHTPQSLYARAVENCSENLLVFEQLIALRTKTLAQFQNTYETLVNRPVLQERLRMQNELIARDLRAIPLPPAGS